MSPPNPYNFFLSEHATALQTADNNIKQTLGPTAGLVTVPHFALPPYRELFTDAEGRFPQLQYLAKYLRESEVDNGREFWFVRVLPDENDRNSRVQGLTVQQTKEGDLRLARQVTTKSFRYVGTLVAEGEGVGGLDDDDVVFMR
jgi:hypothetical protein